MLLELQDASVNDVVLARDDAELPVFDFVKDDAGDGVSSRGNFRMDEGSQTDASLQLWPLD